MQLRRRLELSQDSQSSMSPRSLEIRLEESEEECHRLRDAFEKKQRELQAGLQE